MNGTHIISRKPIHVFLTACHTLFTELFYMVIQINPLSSLFSVNDVCSVNCVIMHIYIYTTMELTFTLEICGVFLQSKPFHSRKLFSSKLS